MISAQKMYDLQQITGFCSSTDLHDLFREVTGKPSPSGYTEIDEQSLRQTKLGAKALEMLEYPLGDMLEAIRIFLDPVQTDMERVPEW